MRSKILFIANALATLYVIYIITYFCRGLLNADGTGVISGAIATTLVTPHILMFFIGAVFGWISFCSKQSWAALVAAILYSVGTLFFLLYAIFGVPILVFGFIGYGMQKKINTSQSN